MPTPEELQKNLLDFAVSIADIVGTEDTNTILQKLTVFAKTNPATVLEVRQIIYENPKQAADLLTPKGIQEVKDMISLVQNMNIF